MTNKPAVFGSQIQVELRNDLLNLGRKTREHRGRALRQARDQSCNKLNLFFTPIGSGKGCQHIANSTPITTG